MPRASHLLFLLLALTVLPALAHAQTSADDWWNEAYPQAFDKSSLKPQSFLAVQKNQIVDEQGRVESASLTAPIHPAFDKELVRMAKRWRYRPATRGGTRVKYATTVAIVLSPTA